MIILKYFCLCVEFAIVSKGTEHPASVRLTRLDSFENFLLQYDFNLSFEFMQS